MKPSGQQWTVFHSRQIPEIALVLYGLVANLMWEFAHSALYQDHTRDISYITWTRVHCSFGDVLILLGAFWWTSLWFRTSFWFRRNNLLPTALFLLSGLAYTVWSEWYNTRIAQTWAYAPSMPTMFGIGLSPIAQWLVVLLLRRREGTRSL